MLPEQNQQIPAQRKRVEDKQRASLSPVIRRPAAGVGVDRAKKSLERVEHADDEHARAQRLQIFGREAEPEFFTRARQHQRHEQQRGVAFERQEVCECSEHGWQNSSELN